MARQNLIQKLKNALGKNILLSEKDKQFWLANAEKLPALLVESICAVVEEKNALMKKYIRAALKSDKEHALFAELKQKIKTIKKKSLQLAEKEQSPDADAMLRANLNKL